MSFVLQQLFRIIVSILTVTWNYVSLIRYLPPVVYTLVSGSIRAITPSFLMRKKNVWGEIVLITGGGSGFGRILAQRFARLGARVVLWDVNQAGNVETEKLIRDELPSAVVLSYKVDLCDKTEIYRLADTVRSDIGSVDILINNAGVVTGKKLLESQDESIERCMQVNCMAHIWTTKAFLPDMIENDHGHIISVSSAAGLIGSVGLIDYCASKFAAVGFLESLSFELDHMGVGGIYTTLVCPFFMDTGMFDGVSSNVIPTITADYAASKTITAILTNQRYLYMPRIIYILASIKSIVPFSCGVQLSHMLGAYRFMEHFVGRRKVVPTDELNGVVKGNDATAMT